MPVPVKGQFIRNDQMNLEYGTIVEYVCFGFQFHVLAMRAGVVIEGGLPPMPGGGANAVVEIIRRAIRQHHVLNVPVGEKQTPLSEQELNMELQHIAEGENVPETAPAPQRLILIPPGAGPHA